MHYDLGSRVLYVNGCFSVQVVLTNHASPHKLRTSFSCSNVTTSSISTIPPERRLPDQGSKGAQLCRPGCGDRSAGKLHRSADQELRNQVPGLRHVQGLQVRCRQLQGQEERRPARAGSNGSVRSDCERKSRSYHRTDDAHPQSSQQVSSGGRKYSAAKL